MAPAGASVFIVDDHSFFRAGLRSLLVQHGFPVVGEAATGEAALPLIERRRPYVVVMDLSMPGRGGHARALRAAQDGDMPLSPRVARLIVGRTRGVPGGAEASAQSFAYTASGDGSYAFYTRAYDLVGNSEAAPATPDATTTVTTPPPPPPFAFTGFFKPMDNPPTINEAKAGSSSLSYDAATKTYNYVWKTEKGWNGCRQLVLKFVDGSYARANMKFK